MSAQAVRWTCWGQVRRGCSKVHRSLCAAGECCAKDSRACRRLGGGAYSDRNPRKLAPGESASHGFSVLDGPGEALTWAEWDQYQGEKGAAGGGR